MSTRLSAPPNQVRLVYGIDEIRAFLDGRATLPRADDRDPIYRTLRRSLARLTGAHPELATGVKVAVAPALGCDSGRFEWHVVTLQAAPVGLDSRARSLLEEWIADHLPDLLFAVADGEGAPLPLAEAQARVARSAAAAARRRVWATGTRARPAPRRRLQIDELRLLPPTQGGTRAEPGAG